MCMPSRRPWLGCAAISVRPQRRSGLSADAATAWTWTRWRRPADALVRSNRTGEEDGRGHEYRDHQDPQLTWRAEIGIELLVVERRLDLVDQEELLGIGEVFLGNEHVHIAHRIDAVDVA